MLNFIFYYWAATLHILHMNDIPAWLRLEISMYHRLWLLWFIGLEVETVQNTVKLYKWRQRLKSEVNLGAVLAHRFSPCKLPSAATMFLMLGDGGCAQWSALCIKYFHDLCTEGVSSAFEQLMTKYDVIPKTYFFRQVLSFIWGMPPFFPLNLYAPH